MFNAAIKLSKTVEEADRWFDKMLETGSFPDELTYKLVQAKFRDITRGELWQWDAESRVISRKTSSTRTRTSPYSTELQKLISDMVFVESGSFNMGSNDSDREVPVHLVEVPAFKIQKCQISQAQWMALLGNNPSKYQKESNCPVESVSWIECQNFIAKLNEHTNLKFRLPTEAEWEFAARGGIKSRGHKFAGSDSLDKVGWSKMNSQGKPSVVGIMAPNELGLFDMSGNVQEWCQDWYSGVYYLESPWYNPQGPTNGTARVVRGGSWEYGPKSCTVSYRAYCSPDAKLGNVGFRLAMNA